MLRGRESDEDQERAEYLTEAYIRRTLGQGRRLYRRYSRSRAAELLGLFVGQNFLLMLTELEQLEAVGGVLGVF